MQLKTNELLDIGLREQHALNRFLLRGPRSILFPDDPDGRATWLSPEGSLERERFGALWREKRTVLRRMYEGLSFLRSACESPVNPTEKISTRTPSYVTIQHYPLTPDDAERLTELFDGMKRTIKQRFGEPPGETKSFSTWRVKIFNPTVELRWSAEGSPKMSEACQQVWTAMDEIVASSAPISGYYERYEVTPLGQTYDVPFASEDALRDSIQAIVDSFPCECQNDD